MMSKTYFISGHLDLSQEEFDANYKDRIVNAINNNSNFVIGESRGADSLGQKLLSVYTKKDLSLYDRVTVYHMFDTPRNNFGNFITIGGFTSDEERDEAMTKASDEDILWMRDPKEQRKRLGAKYNPYHISGTTKNMLRRKK
jgi:hypothetical protein